MLSEGRLHGIDDLLFHGRFLGKCRHRRTEQKSSQT